MPFAVLYVYKKKITNTSVLKLLSYMRKKLFLQFYVLLQCAKV